jgi:hypothetical protein
VPLPGSSTTWNEELFTIGAVYSSSMQNKNQYHDGISLIENTNGNNSNNNNDEKGIAISNSGDGVLVSISLIDTPLLSLEPLFPNRD